MASEQVQPVPGILAKLALVRRDVGAIGKNRQMSMGGGKGYAYRGIEDLYDALWPALDAHGVVVIPNVAPSSQTWTSKEVVQYDKPKQMTRCTAVIAYTLFDVDSGTSITGSALAEGLCDSDKASGKASSYSAKNFWFHFLQIPTEDPDASRPEAADQGETLNKKVAKRIKETPMGPLVTKEEWQESRMVSTFEIATSLQELKAAWDNLPQEHRTESVVKAKDLRKAQLQAQGGN